MNNTEAVLLADAPDALTKVCGITLLERLLRILQRLGFRKATIVSTTPDAIRAALSKPSWARSGLHVDLGPEIPMSNDRTLIVPANVYCDLRLLRALCERSK